MRMLRWAVLLGLLVLVMGGGLLWREQQARVERDEALALARAGRFDDAEPRLRAYQAGRGPDPAVLAALARGYRAAGRPADAEDALTRWLGAHPDDIEALRLRRDLYAERRDLEPARADAARVVALAPAEPRDRRRLAGLSFSAGHFRDAERECLAVLQALPDDRAARVLLAETYRALGEPGRAADLLDRLLASDSSHVPALMTRAILYDEADEPAKAVPLFRRARELNPKGRRITGYHLSLALARSGQAAEAERVRAEVRAMQDADVLLEDSLGQPRNVDLQVRAARALLANDQPDLALPALQRALAADPDCAAAHQLLAEFYDRQGDLARAAAHRRRAGGAP